MGRFNFSVSGGSNRRLFGTYTGSATKHHFIDASGAYATDTLGGDEEAVSALLLQSMGSRRPVSDELSDVAREDFLDVVFSSDAGFGPCVNADEYYCEGRSSGSEANELALRLVWESQYNQRTLKAHGSKRHKILGFRSAWHGWTSGVRRLTDRRYYAATDPPNAEPIVDFLPFGATDAIQQYMTVNGSELLAVVVEPVLGDGGIITPPDGFLSFLIAQAHSHGAFVVVDEVLTCLKGPTPIALQTQPPADCPDIVVVGKGLGMGVSPMSLVFYRKELKSRADLSISTFNLRPQWCSFVGGALNYISRERLLSTASTANDTMRESIRQGIGDSLASVAEVRGYGCMTAIELAGDARDYVQEARRTLLSAGVYVEAVAGGGRRTRAMSGDEGRSGPALRVVMPLNAESSLLDDTADALVRGLDAFEQVQGQRRQPPS